ncbi:hypothetical protein FH972_025897 [Carpinus fangiana]|uniref:Fumarylacetoacetase-like C-terminal domain-containing protein n=1 Tax=Carpinus fangiana TaxID=176857 RepID=A0A5N6L2G0_9ROSI|nr:hypothetical protein FH972_025897 [Carpinus fangiana]
MRATTRLLSSLHTAASLKANCRKPPTSILTPGAGPVLLPAGVVAHYELELGLLIGRRLTDLAPDDTRGAFAAISAYVLAIDLTARNVQDEAKKKGLPWSIAKGFDTFCPISNVIPKERLGDDPYSAKLTLEVNGQTKQSDKAELMLFRIPRILSDISRVMTLEEGDLVLTGTPKGVGPVRAGEKMTARLEVNGREIEEGRMEVDVVERKGGYVFAET